MEDSHTSLLTTTPITSYNTAHDLSRNCRAKDTMLIAGPSYIVRLSAANLATEQDVVNAAGILVDNFERRIKNSQTDFVTHWDVDYVDF